MPIPRATRHNTFNPSRYQTASNRPSVARREMSPRSQLKNGGLSIAGPDIKTLLSELKQYSSVQIENLNPVAREKFDRLVQFVQALYDTDDYETLYSWVKEEYGKLKHVYPGTVGAYMAGCMVSTSLSDNLPGCAICCAASIPRPRSDSQFHHCRNTIIGGEYDGEQYTFMKFKTADSDENHKVAYLYINSTDTANYPGFSLSEKKQLTEFGLERVKVYGYNSNGREYVELTPLITIAELKDRSRHHSHYDEHPRRHPVKHTSSSTIWWWICLLIIVFIVVIVVVGIIWMKNTGVRRNTTVQTATIDGTQPYVM